MSVSSVCYVFFVYFYVYCVFVSSVFCLGVYFTLCSCACVCLCICEYVRLCRRAFLLCAGAPCDCLCIAFPPRAFGGFYCVAMVLDNIDFGLVH